MSNTDEGYFPLATETAVDNGPSLSGEDAGAAGESSGGIELSHGAMVAIIVIVVVFAVLGIGMSVLYYLAKKREWKVRERMRRSARKVVTALTPRRSEFSKRDKDGSRSTRGRSRIDDVPPTPRLRPEDVEKGLGVSAKVESRDSSSEGKKKMRWPGHY